MQSVRDYAWENIDPGRDIVVASGTIKRRGARRHIVPKNDRPVSPGLTRRSFPEEGTMERA
jgi:hypothetical protein